MINIYKEGNGRGISIRTITRITRFYRQNRFTKNYKYNISELVCSFWIKNYQITIRIPFFIRKIKMPIEDLEQLQTKINELYKQIIKNQNSFGVQKIIESESLT